MSCPYASVWWRVGILEHVRRSWRHAALLLAALTLAIPGRARCQVRGVVADSGGRPLPGVLVELWGPAQRLAGQSTDATGRFFLSGTHAGPRAILARRIGLVPLRRTVLPGESLVVLLMATRAVEVSPVAVEASRTACPRRDDPRARALWQRAAGRYDVELSARGVFAPMRRFSAVVPLESLGVIDTTRLLDAVIAGGLAGPGARSRRLVYAEHAVGVLPPRFDLWRYAFLESIHAWHFADAQFGAENRLALTRSAAGETAIAFCSRRGDRPYVRGTVTLGPDTTIASAEWEFVTPESREEAGGLVLFAPTDAVRSSQPLLPVAGLYWRKRLRDAYQEWMEYRQWLRCADPTCGTKVPLQ